jgi:hypothetical protein
MTVALPVAEKIRTRYRAERQHFSEAQYVLRPAERLRVQAQALGGYLNQSDSVLDPRVLFVYNVTTALTPESLRLSRQA